MNPITQDLGTLYHPVKALLLYRTKGGSYQESCYVESYDIGADGKPLNAHPLTVQEGEELIKALSVKVKKEREHRILNPRGLLPSNVLYLNTGKNACAVWRTPAQKVGLLFDKALQIACGEAAVPPLVWKASRKELMVFAMKGRKVTPDTPLFRAPFFNIGERGRVCMGNVRVQIPPDCCIEDFMRLWQTYFFNSYFTHLIGSDTPVKGNIVQLWQKLVGSEADFPLDSLKHTSFTLKQLLA